MRQVFIFDTTLRDGEQAANRQLGPLEKLAIAGPLAQLMRYNRRNTLEGGFPGSSPGDYEAVTMLAKKIKGIGIAGLTKSFPLEGVETVYNAVKYADEPVIHIVSSTSDIHMEKKLNKTEDQVYEDSVAAVLEGKKLLDRRGRLEFSCEDATRSRMAFLCKISKGVLEAGADIVNFPDTVGYITPWEYEQMISELLANVPSLAGKISVHCHNDLGNAVSNSLAGARAGAIQIEGTINGIGERAGNASLEQMIAQLKARRDFYNIGLDVDTHLIHPLSMLVRNLMDMPVAYNTPIIGKHAFEHRSGIHQDGVIKDVLTYEILNREDYGLPAQGLLDRIIITSRSGRRAIKEILESQGYLLVRSELNRVYELAMNLADKKGTSLTTDDLIALLNVEVRKIPQSARLLSYSVKTGSDIKPYAEVSIQTPSGTVTSNSAGDGPIDAAYRAINSALGKELALCSFNIFIVGTGKEAQGEARVLVSSNGKEHPGRGVSTDIIEASIKAYMDAINSLN